MNEKDQITSEAQKYELLDSLMKHQGWPILQELINNYKDAVLQGLLKESDHKKMIALQERYRAFNSVEDTLKSAKNIKEKLYQDLNNIIEDEKLRKQFEL